MVQLSQIHTRRLQRLFALVLTVTLLNAVANSAQACGICVTAIADRYMPPVTLWSGLAVLWFLATAFLSSLYSVKIEGSPNFVWGIVIVVACFLLVSGFFGLVAFLPLGLLGARVFLWTMLGGRPSIYPPRVHTAIYRLGVIMLLLVGYACVQSYKIQTTRTPEEFEARWHLNRTVRP
jgi:hypothetical protein